MVFARLCQLTSPLHRLALYLLSPLARYFVYDKAVKNTQSGHGGWMDGYLRLGLGR